MTSTTLSAQRVFKLLDEDKVPYTVLAHREAFTAQGVAAASHVSGWTLAKVLVLREKGGSPFMVVLPASCRLDLPTLATLTKRAELTLLPEYELAPLFPDCETGAIPPFGHLYGMPVYVDACFPRAQDLVFQAGNHHEVVRMKYLDFERLAQPTLGDFCRH